MMTALYIICGISALVLLIGGAANNYIYVTVEKES